MECMPLESEEVEYVATPLALMATSLRTVALSLKVTVPFGATPPPPEITTVAVNVTTDPTVEGFALELMLVAVTSFTTCTMDVEVLTRWRLSPLYTDRKSVV